MLQFIYGFLIKSERKSRKNSISIICVPFDESSNINRINFHIECVFCNLFLQIRHLLDRTKETTNCFDYKWCNQNEIEITIAC